MKIFVALIILKSKSFLIAMFKNFSTLLITLFIFANANLYSQISIDSLFVDSLFNSWHNDKGPGDALGIMQNDSLIFIKSQGFASLEYDYQINNQTIFNLASVSKQFTAMAILFLEEQGRLKLSDDIRNYIPQIPNFGNKITLRHLLHHTSGLRSYHDLLGLAGWRSSDFRNNQDLLRLIQKQKELNFKPGEEYLYCNTGYILLSIVVEKITNLSFKDWMQSNIFLPLDMTSTYVEDHNDNIISNKATSYYTNGALKRANEYWGYTGTGNIHSNISDLLKWGKNFYAPALGWEKLFSKMLTTTPLNDGSYNPYAMGINIENINGKRMIKHEGGVGGFRTYLGIIPSEKIVIAYLSNYSSSEPEKKVNKILEHLINKEVSIKNIQENFITINKESLKRLVGSYWNDKDKYQIQIYMQKDTLYVKKEESKWPILPVTTNKFKIIGSPSNFYISFEVKDNYAKIMLSNGKEKSQFFNRISLQKPEKNEINAYKGEYYSEELETSYKISVSGENIYLSHIRQGTIQLNYISKDILEGRWPANTVQVIRGNNKEISGIKISNNRVRNLLFTKRK